jgi:hypothetical protein
VAGFQAVVVWQVSQVAVVGTWVADLPRPLPVEVRWAPSWQLAQTDPATAVWLIAAGFQAVLLLLWQLSQVAVVGMWLVFLPKARVPAMT